MFVCGREHPTTLRGQEIDCNLWKRVNSKLHWWILFMPAFKGLMNISGIWKKKIRNFLKNYESHSVMSNFLWPPWTVVWGILQARILEWVAISFSRGSSQPRDRPRSPALQADALPSEPPGKPKNTAVGRLSLLQGIFLTQGLNPGLPHCRQMF